MEGAPLPWSTIPQMLDASFEAFGGRSAIVSEDRTWTYAELAYDVHAAARGLLAADVSLGDRVAIWAPNVPEFVVVALAALRIGAVVVPLNTRYKGQEAAYILQRSNARVLFTVGDFLDTDYVAMLRDARGAATSDRPVADLPDLQRIVLLSGRAPGATDWDGFLADGELTDDSSVAAACAEVRPGDTSDIMFTSGTTGNPKGVVTTHEQTLRVFEVWSRLVGLTAGDRYLIVNPFFHTFGYKAGFLSAVMRGATIFPHAVFEGGSVLKRIAAERITFLPGPPALYNSIMDHADFLTSNTGSLRTAVTGAASIPVSLIERMREVMGFEVVLTAYGLTEATGVVSMCQPDDDPETIAHFSGRAIEGTQIRTVDDDGNDTAVGEPGEVIVRGYNVMQGYFEDPAQTSEAIRDGWLYTGDIGVLDERGYLDITDRKKDLFIVGGFNAYPAEIENALIEHPAIAQVAVVGMPDERLGEVGCAFVVAATGHEVDEAALTEWARERIANFKVPRRFIAVDTLPANASGKVLKGPLRDQAAALAAEAAS